MDPIADMFSQIKNAQGAKKESLTVTFSKIKLAILAILKNHHQIADFRLIEKKNVSKSTKEKEQIYQVIEINLLEDSLTDIRRISRPGRRIYASSFNIPRPKRRQAITIVSTSKGVLEGEDARRQGVGGEVIAEIK